jgi:NitT/TauT family transport system substrate-binding protein
MAIDRRFAAVLAAAVVVGVSAGAVAQPMTAVTQLGWLRIGEYGPIIVADVKGFFADEGITHKTVDGGPGKNPIPIVAVGQAQFGLATQGMQIIAARAARDPVDVVAIGTLFQQAPSSFLSLANPGAPQSKPKDMEGKTVGIQAETEFVYKAFARKNGIDLSKVKVAFVKATAEPLMVGQIDYFSGWVVNQTYQIEQEAAKPDAPAAIKGKEWRALRLAEWGIPTYTDVIFTSGDTLKNNPELVRRYLKAVTRGMQYILDHPDETVELVAKAPGQIEDAKKLAWRWKLQSPLFVSEDTKKNGLLWMNPGTWEQMESFLKEGEQIPRLLPVSQVMTNDYLPKPGAH